MSPGSRRLAAECGLWRENAAWVKGLGGGMWSRRANLPRGSKDLAAECGLGGRICCLGQEGRRCSVVCGAKTPRGSKKLLVQCGLWRENAAWVKGLGGGMWSRRANLTRGSKDLAAECGLGGRICCLGQESRWCSVV